MIDGLSFFFSSRRRHTRSDRDWSSDVCSSDLPARVRVACARGSVSAFAFEVRPLAVLYEVGPVERVELLVLTEHFELHAAQRVAAPEALFEIPVVARHQRARRVVADGPEAHHERLRAREDEGAAQAVDAL